PEQGGYELRGKVKETFCLVEDNYHLVPSVFAYHTSQLLHEIAHTIRYPRRRSPP
uniref:Uncharacterized protein n=1 Tax=Plectus sambesii TaxID=2011161 RepID=A0A914VYC5_9BILA